MRVEQLNLIVEAQAGPLPIWRAEVDAERWRSLAAQLAAADCRLVSLWGSDGVASTGGAQVSAGVEGGERWNLVAGGDVRVAAAGVAGAAGEGEGAREESG